MYAFAKTIREEGKPIEPLLAKAGISQATFDDPYSLIPYVSACAFYGSAAEYSSRPALGLAAARNCDAAQLHLLEYLFASASNLGEGVRSFVENSLRPSSVGRFSLEPYGDHVLLRFAPLDQAMPPCFIAYVVGTVFLIGRRVVGGEKPPGTRAWFAFAKPQDDAEYRSFFQGEVRFDAPAHGLFMAASALQLKMCRANPRLRQTLEEELHASTQRFVQSSSVSDRVRSLISAALPEGDIGMVAVARKLHMSRSTLRRKLAFEGTSHRALVQTVRASVAIRYLRRADFSIGEIARLVGYDDIAAFHKAFKQWTGSTPAEQRARFRAGNGRNGDARIARD
jgi:AraC-like DNA-binding protein